MYYLLNSFSNYLQSQKILAHARAAEAGLVPRDPPRESIALELDFINILYVSYIDSLKGGTW